MQELFRHARHLAFIALVARAVMPMGWMPAAQGLTICSVDGPHREIPAQDGQAQHDVQKDACPFAAAPPLAATPDAPSLALPVFHAFAAATDRLYAASVAARFSPASPRAPPLNA